MRAFVRSRRKRLDRATTFFIALDSVGGGRVRYATSAGWVVSYDMDRRLVELCEAIATADAETDDRYGAAGFASGLGGDDDARAAAGFRATGAHLPRR